MQAVPITVKGIDALGQPFKERTTTVMVNCHGCKYQSKHYVPKNSMVTLDIPRPEGGPFHTQGRVVWVQRPRTVRELFQIGLEFEVPGNFWGIAFPPEDWASGVDIPTGDLTGMLEVATAARAGGWYFAAAIAADWAASDADSDGSGEKGLRRRRFRFR